MADRIESAKYYDQRFESLKTERSPRESEWRDLNDYILPYRGRFQATDAGKAKRNRKILDGTATYAARTLKSGLMAGVTSPARPWFKLQTPDPAMMKMSAVKIWIETVEERMMQVFAKSNFYNILPNVYEELGIFGTACMLAYEDAEDMVRFYGLTVGEYLLETDDRGSVCGVWFERQMTIGQAAKKYGVENLSTASRQLHERGMLDEKITVRVAIDPNDEFQDGMLGFKGKKYRSIHWERGSDQKNVLLKSGFNSKPFMAPRWNAIGLDPYGFGAGIEVLGDVIGLQAMTKKKARAVDKQVDPPMNASGAMKTSGATFSTEPNAINFVEGMGQNVGFQPAIQMNPNLTHFVQDIQEVQRRVKSGLYENLFLMIAEMDRANITATEIIERKAEKLIALSPVIERMNDELLEPIIDRVFEILQTATMANGQPFLPPAPRELANVPLTVEFVSIFRQAQQQEDVTKTVSYVKNLALMSQATGDPSVMDNLDADEAAAILGNKGGVPATVMTPDDKKQAIRQARSQVQQQQQQQQNALAIVQAAKELGNTPITQDQNALSRMMGIAG